MWQQEFIWFFTLFQQEFRKNNPIAGRVPIFPVRLLAEPGVR